MMNHHIIGSERPGPHVEVRRFKPDRYRSVVFWIVTSLQLSAVTGFVGIAWSVAVRL